MRNLGNYESYINYLICRRMAVVTIDNTSHTRSLHIICGLNTRVIYNRVFESYFWVTELIPITRTIDQSYER